MKKQEMQQKVLQNGKPLDLDKFSWDEQTKTFSTKESNLVCNFGGLFELKIITDSFCTFITGSECVFRTGSNCTFITGSECVFITDSNCTFITPNDCTFITGINCTFNTGSKCVCVRRDMFEFFEIPKDQKIMLNPFREKGYQLIITNK